MNNKSNILGCFVSCQAISYDSKKTEEDKQTEQEIASQECKLFRSYIWGEKGISDKLKKLNYKDYGDDLILALFQFKVKPTPIELEHLKEIESYRKKEKSIGIPIIVNEENFFSQSEEGRYLFLRQVIFDKLDLLTEVVKKKKLDTNMDLLKSDLQKVLL